MNEIYFSTIFEIRNPHFIVVNYNNIRGQRDGPHKGYAHRLVSMQTVALELNFYSPLPVHTLQMCA